MATPPVERTPRSRCARAAGMPGRCDLLQGRWETDSVGPVAVRGATVVPDLQTEGVWQLRFTGEWRVDVLADAASTVLMSAALDTDAVYSERAGAFRQITWTGPESSTDVWTRIDNPQSDRYFGSRDYGVQPGRVPPLPPQVPPYAGLYDRGMGGHGRESPADYGMQRRAGYPPFYGYPPHREGLDDHAYRCEEYHRPQTNRSQREMLLQMLDELDNSARMPSMVPEHGPPLGQQDFMVHQRRLHVEDRMGPPARGAHPAMPPRDRPPLQDGGLVGGSVPSSRGGLPEEYPPQWSHPPKLNTPPLAKLRARGLGREAASRGDPMEDYAAPWPNSLHTAFGAASLGSDTASRGELPEGHTPQRTPPSQDGFQGLEGQDGDSCRGDVCMALATTPVELQDTSVALQDASVAPSTCGGGVEDLLRELREARSLPAARVKALEAVAQDRVAALFEESADLYRAMSSLKAMAPCQPPCKPLRDKAEDTAGEGAADPLAPLSAELAEMRLIMAAAEKREAGLQVRLGQEAELYKSAMQSLEVERSEKNKEQEQCQQVSDELLDLQLTTKFDSVEVKKLKQKEAIEDKRRAELEGQYTSAKSEICDLRAELHRQEATLRDASAATQNELCQARARELARLEEQALEAVEGLAREVESACRESPAGLPAGTPEERETHDGDAATGGAAQIDAGAGFTAAMDGVVGRLSRSWRRARGIQEARVAELARSLQRESEASVEECARNDASQSELEDLRREVRQHQASVLELRATQGADHAAELGRLEERETEARAKRDAEHAAELERREGSEAEACAERDREAAEARALLARLHQHEEVEADELREVSARSGELHELMDDELKEARDELMEARKMANNKLISTRELLERRDSEMVEMDVRLDAEVVEFQEKAKQLELDFERQQEKEHSSWEFKLRQLREKAEAADIEAARLREELQQRRERAAALESELAQARGGEPRTGGGALRERAVARDIVEVRQSDELEARNRKLHASLLSELRWQRVKFNTAVSWSTQQGLMLARIGAGLLEGEMHVKELAEMLSGRDGEARETLAEQREEEAMVYTEETPQEEARLKLHRALNEARLAWDEASLDLDVFQGNVMGWRNSSEDRATDETEFQNFVQEKTRLLRESRDWADDARQRHVRACSIKVFRAERIVDKKRRDAGISSPGSLLLDQDELKSRDQMETPEVTTPEPRQFLDMRQDEGDDGSPVAARLGR